MHQVHLLVVIGADEEVEHEILEGRVLERAFCVKLRCKLRLCFINSIEYRLVSLGRIQNHFLMDIILDHEQEIANLQLLKTFLAQMSL